MAELVKKVGKNKYVVPYNGRNFEFSWNPQMRRYHCVSSCSKLGQWMQDDYKKEAAEALKILVAERPDPTPE